MGFEVAQRRRVRQARDVRRNRTSAVFVEQQAARSFAAERGSRASDYVLLVGATVEVRQGESNDRNFPAPGIRELTRLDSVFRILTVRIKGIL